jgi:hypothetical protein
MLIDPIMNSSNNINNINTLVFFKFLVLILLICFCKIVQLLLHCRFKDGQMWYF